MKLQLSFAAFLILLIAACNTKPEQKNNPLAKASRKDTAGWINIHLEGTPAEIGYQHGFLLANEIDTCIKMIAYYNEHETKKDWAFYRQAAQNFLWGKLDREYKDEINGIVAGLQAQHKNYDSLDITAYNAFEELVFYYVPSLMNAAVAHSGDNKAPGNCSAFIATGSYTKDGKIVMGHNNWTSYMIGQHWNVVADIVPEKGNHILMDCMPGFIHSGDDFLITANGILITETTITQFALFDLLDFSPLPFSTEFYAFG